MFKLRTFILVILPSCFLIVLILYFPEKFLYILKGSMPYRDMFLPKIDYIGVSKEPNIIGIFIFYILPILYGILIGFLFCINISSKNYYIHLCASSLSFSLLYILPIQLLIPVKNIESFLSVGFLYLLIPVLVSFGILISNYNYINSVRTFMFSYSSQNNNNISIIFYITLLLYIILKYFINCFSKYPIGFDIYYHTALSINIAQGESIFRNPIFYEGYNVYSPFIHYFIAKLFLISNINIFKIWIIVDIFSLSIFLLSLYYFIKHITKNNVISLLTIILILPWDQFWIEISSRHFALIFIPLNTYILYKYIINKNVKEFLLLILFLILILASHLSLFIIYIIFITIFFITNKYYLKISILITKLFKIINFLLSKLLFFILPEEKIFITFDSKDLINLILIYFSCLMYFVYNGILNYPIGNILYFNEIALSLYRPIGTITFITFIFALPGIPLLFRKIEKNLSVIIFSYLILYFTVFFYITRIFIIYPNVGLSYSRTFAEIAYIGFAILGSIVLYNVNVMITKRERIIIYMIIILFLISSIYPKISFNYWYGNEITERMEVYEGILQEISKLPIDSVILTDTEDMINRYIPGISGRHIFAVRYFKTENRKYLIISPTLNMFMKDDMERRYLLSIKFFENPWNKNILDTILENYRVTNLLVTKKYFDEYKLSDINMFNILVEKNGYVLLEIL